MGSFYFRNGYSKDSKIHPKQHNISVGWKHNVDKWYRSWPANRVDTNEDKDEDDVAVDDEWRHSTN